MGVVIKQSFLNTLILFFGFAIGGVNVLFLYTHFLTDEYFGLVTFLLSSANIMMPFLIIGMQHTIIRFFPKYQNQEDKDSFLMLTLILPLLVIIPIGTIGVFSYEFISNLIATKNALIKNYTYLIFLVAIFMGYFEVFYAWSKVQLKSVFGHFIKELFARISVSVLLIGVYLKWLTPDSFIKAVVLIYALRMIIMFAYSVIIHKPKFKFFIPENIKEILSFSVYILVAGSAAGILLEIDKVMIPQIEILKEVAYYSVGIYIASVIAIPTRAMQQITNPIVAQEIHHNNWEEISKLYRQTSINLLIVGGFLFLIINLNINDLYELINKPEYTKGVLVVIIISFAKIMELSLGVGNAILVNSKYFKIFFYLSIAMALSVIGLNYWLIPVFGINGAALATFIVVFTFTLVKMGIIYKKFKISPFSNKTLLLGFIIISCYLVFYYWTLNINSVLNIIVKSIIITLIYLFLITKMKISSDINEQINSIFKQKNH